MAWCGYAEGRKRHSGRWQTLFPNPDGAALSICDRHALPCSGCDRQVQLLTEVDKPVGAGALHPVVVLCRSCLIGVPIVCPDGSCDGLSPVRPKGMW